ncbi:unnamed protein product [Orchesella dallaii]|uniref:Sushi domain-containing protein n=1 Tax=Orchesella dallaii TaxID=48710 RepID=A0ABP1RSA3_9HEXA
MHLINRDSTFGTDEYFDLSSTEADPTPMVYFGGALVKNESCTAYGDAIDTYNRGFDEFNDKTRRLRLEAETAGVFGTGICNWVVARLQCIPNQPRLPPTTTPAPPSPPGGSPDEENIILDRPEGSCQCMVALGEKAVAVKNENGTEICYIPANRGYHSKCSHEIFLPYGGIDGVKQSGEPYVKLEMQPASKFCVPNAECKTGYKYTGLRCMCKKNYVWEPLTSTCARALRLKPMSCSSSSIIFFAIFILFKNV